jgi:uncharacterized protein YceK
MKLKNTIRSLAVLGVSMILSGCGSLYLRTIPESHVDPYLGCARDGVYRGVRGDIKMFRDTSKDKAEDKPEHWTTLDAYTQNRRLVNLGLTLYAIDVPLSAILDTAFLPIDIFCVLFLYQEPIEGTQPSPAGDVPKAAPEE